VTIQDFDMFGKNAVKVFEFCEYLRGLNEDVDEEVSYSPLRATFRLMVHYRPEGGYSRGPGWCISIADHRSMDDIFQVEYCIASQKYETVYVMPNRKKPIVVSIDEFYKEISLNQHKDVV